MSADEKILVDMYGRYKGASVCYNNVAKYIVVVEFVYEKEAFATSLCGDRVVYLVARVFIQTKFQAMIHRFWRKFFNKKDYTFAFKKKVDESWQKVSDSWSNFYRNYTGGWGNVNFYENITEVQFSCDDKNAEKFIHDAQQRLIAEIEQMKDEDKI